MKSHQAAVLALVGWYLMVRPRPFTEKAPPPSEWSVYNVYKSADNCEWSRREIASGVLEGVPSDFLERFGNGFMGVFKQATCIATDDPRLKEK